jgi:hypothetical protein
LPIGGRPPTITGVTSLAATLHDPDGRSLPLLRRHGHVLATYSAAAVAATDETDEDVLAALIACGALVVPGGPLVGRARLNALAAASRVADGDVVAIDFDRWLVWADTHPEELLALPRRLAARRPAPWYACVGRTARAWRTHPRVQRACEDATNRALSLAAGRTLDATAGCCWLAKEGVRIVLAHSTEPTNATDLEWPAFVLRHDPKRLVGARVEGLAFETAAFYPDEITAAGGQAAWVAQAYERPEAWATRLGLAADSAAALTRVLAGGRRATNGALEYGPRGEVPWPLDG